MSKVAKHEASVDKAFAKEQIARGPATVSANDSVTVAIAAGLLGCDQSTVRVLLNAGQLMGHRVGKGLNPRHLYPRLVNPDYNSNVVNQIANNDNLRPTGLTYVERTQAAGTLKLLHVPCVGPRRSSMRALASCSQEQSSNDRLQGSTAAERVAL